MQVESYSTCNIYHFSVGLDGSLSMAAMTRPKVYVAFFYNLEQLTEFGIFGIHVRTISRSKANSDCPIYECLTETNFHGINFLRLYIPRIPAKYENMQVSI